MATKIIDTRLFEKYGINFPDSELKRWIQVIEMEKECRGYSYMTLAKMLEEKMPEYAISPNGSEKDAGDGIRERLRAKNPDPKLIGAILEVLEIEPGHSFDEDMKRSILASRYQAEAEDSIKRADAHWSKKKKSSQFQAIRQKHEKSVYAGDEEAETLMEAALLEMDEEAVENYSDCIEREREQMKRKLMYMCDYREKEILEFLASVEFDKEELVLINVKYNS